MRSGDPKTNISTGKSTITIMSLYESICKKLNASMWNPHIRFCLASTKLSNYNRSRPPPPIPGWKRRRPNFYTLTVKIYKES